MVSDKDVQELREFLSGEELKTESKLVPVQFDGKQFCTRIPKKFAETLRLSKGRDRFCFVLELPKDMKEKPRLTGVLMKEDEAKI